MNPPTIRLSLPSKGRLQENAISFLASAGLSVFKPNPRQYQAQIPVLPELGVLFQRPGDIVVSVRQGSVDFGITGMDVVEENRGSNGNILILHDALGFGHCSLMLAIPESWTEVTNISALKKYVSQLDHPLRVATKFPVLTERFLSQHDVPHTLISAATHTAEFANGLRKVIAAHDNGHRVPALIRFARVHRTNGWTLQAADGSLREEPLCDRLGIFAAHIRNHE